jgi:mono/diheme cytochrome c family protein
MRAGAACSSSRHYKNRIHRDDNQMKLSEHLPKIFVLAMIVGGLGLVASKYFGTSDGGASTAITVPTLSPIAAAGKAVFDANCAVCHGENASGTEQGPPLIHDIYNPGHHGDQSFLLAVRRGVRQHHWPFGNMAPLPDVSDAQVAEIIRYVREVQEANGIAYRPHRM